MALTLILMTTLERLTFAFVAFGLQTLAAAQGEAGRSTGKGS